MGGAMFPPYYLTWGQTMVEVMKVMVTSFKRSPAGTATLSVPNPAAGQHWTMPPPEIPRHSWASLGQSLMGSLLLSPGSWCAQDSVCPLQESVSQSCVSPGGSMVGLMATSSKRAYAIPKSAGPRAPAPEAVHCWPGPPQETPKNRSVSVSVGVSLSWCTQGVFEPSEHLCRVWVLILNMILPLLPSC